MQRWKNTLPSLRDSLLLSLLTFPLWIDGVSNVLGIWDTPGEVRYLFGLQFGLAIPLLFIPILQHHGSRIDGQIASLRNWLDFGILSAVGLFFLAALTSRWGLALWSILGYFVTIGVACLATISLSSAKNLVLLGLTARTKNRRIHRGTVPVTEWIVNENANARTALHSQRETNT